MHSPARASPNFLLLMIKTRQSAREKLARYSKKKIELGLKTIGKLYMISVLIFVIELFMINTVARCFNRGILVYNICLISISNSVSDGATNKSVLNIESS